MKKALIGLLFVGLVVVFLIAAGPKSYQATGKITVLTDSVITIEKANGEVWEIGRDANLKVTGGTLAVGAKVTIMYKMIGVTADIKK